MEGSSKCRRYCSVPRCKKKGGRMFWFPKNEVVRSVWQVMCGINKPITNTMNICGLHFRNHDILRTREGRYRIKKGAVPSLNLPDPATAPVIQSKEARKKARRRCAVPNCGKYESKDHGITLRFFPRRHELQRVWQNLCKINVTSRDTRICSLHFAEDDLSETLKRRRNILPSRNLPTDEELQRPDEGLNDKTDISDLDSISVFGSENESVGNEAACTSSVSDTSIIGYENECEPTELGALLNDKIYDDSVDSWDVPNHESTSQLEEELSTEDAIQEIQSCVVSSDEVSYSSSVGEQLISFINDSNSDNTTESQDWMQVGRECPQKKTVLDLITDEAHFCIMIGVSAAVLDCLCSLVEKVIGDSGKHKTPLKVRIALTLCKLRLNLSFSCLAILFGLNRRLCGVYFASTINKLANVLRCTIYWPSKEENLHNTPKVFRKFKDTQVVLDCTEVMVDSPDCRKCRIRMYSHYKGKLTVKFLLGVAPSGLISFVSKVYGGRASDKKIFEESELISKNLIEPFPAIMVDKGFRIDQVCDERYIKIHRPPFVVRKQQLNRADAIHNAEVASARVHVERVIQRMKIFMILQNKLRWAMVPHINNIVTVIAGLVNLGKPVMSAQRFITQPQQVSNSNSSLLSE